MNVLHLITGRGPTGPAAAAMLDVKSLRAAGHQAWICSGSGTGLDDACRVESIPYLGGVKLGRGLSRLLGLLGDVPRLRQILQEHKIDVLHVHRSDDQLTAGVTLSPIYRARSERSVRLIRTWHRDPRTLPHPLLASLAAHTNGCIGVARVYADALKSLSVCKVEFLHTAVDTDVFHPQSRENWAKLASSFLSADTLSDHTFLIGHAGRWKRDRDGRDRGQGAALHVFAQVLEQQSAGSSKPDWQGWLIGRGERGEALRQDVLQMFGEKCATGGLSTSASRVKLVEAMEHSPTAFAALLARLDLGLVFATGSDGTSRAAVEMLSCGVPLLVADLPGLRELAEETDCVKCLPPNQPQVWAQAVCEHLQRTPEQCAELKAKARARAETLHSLKAHGLALAKFYEK